MGSFKGLKQVRRVVEDCIKNVMHPVYHIKVSYTVYRPVRGTYIVVPRVK